MQDNGKNPFLLSADRKSQRSPEKRARILTLPLPRSCLSGPIRPVPRAPCPPQPRRRRIRKNPRPLFFSAAPLGLGIFFVSMFPGLRSRWSLDPGLKCAALSGLAFGRAKNICVHWCEFVVPATRVLRRLSILGVLRKCAANNDFRRIRFAAGPRIRRPFRAGMSEITISPGSSMGVALRKISPNGATQKTIGVYSCVFVVPVESPDSGK